MGEFKWEIEQPIAVAPLIPKIVTIGQWVAEFERQYWTKKERTTDAELNYRTDYGSIFEKIDQDRAIIATAKVVRTAQRLKVVASVLNDNDIGG